MKKRIVVSAIIIIFLGILFTQRNKIFQTTRPAENEKAFKEFSVNLDMPDIEPVMRLIAENIESGFTESDIKKAAGLAERLGVDEEGRLDLEIRYKGKPGTLRVQIVMDDVSSPDVYFFSDLPELIKKIEEIVTGYMKKEGR